LVRARGPTLAVACVYVLSVTVGAVMVHSGNTFALGYGDRLVERAHAADPASLALASGQRFQAAAWDFGRNLLLGAVPETVGGLAIVLPYLAAGYRGWIGGIVSVDRTHISRFRGPAERRYYLVTMVLQLIPYSLAGGAGVSLGLAYLRGCRPGSRWLGLPRAAVQDVLRIYLVVVPLFAIASAWEFLAR
jgi:hypothetical protein